MSAMPATFPGQVVLPVSHQYRFHSRVERIGLACTRVAAVSLTQGVELWGDLVDDVLGVRSGSKLQQTHGEI